jgi:hypothetical protein
MQVAAIELTTANAKAIRLAFRVITDTHSRDARRKGKVLARRRRNRDRAGFVERLAEAELH